MRARANEYGVRMGLHDFKRRLFAKYYDRITGGYDAAVREQKLELLRNLNGTVVEIGPGTGANLQLLPEGVSWIGIEPNEHMHSQLQAKADELGLTVDVRCLSAGKLPLEDESVDCVLSTLVLCSVPDVAGVLREIQRVLKPGGQFVFWEHVISPEGALLRGFQHMITPFQRFIADGCCCNRDFGKSLREANFRELRIDAFQVPGEVAPAWIRHHVSGVAER